MERCKREGIPIQILRIRKEDGKDYLMILKKREGKDQLPI